jgi:hypothetical protein
MNRLRNLVVAGIFGIILGTLIYFLRPDESAAALTLLMVGTNFLGAGLAGQGVVEAIKRGPP